MYVCTLTPHRSACHMGLRDITSIYPIDLVSTMIHVHVHLRGDSMMMIPDVSDDDVAAAVSTAGTRSGGGGAEAVADPLSYQIDGYRRAAPSRSRTDLPPSVRLDRVQKG